MTHKEIEIIISIEIAQRWTRIGITSGPGRGKLVSINLCGDAIQFHDELEILGEEEGGDEQE
jgi:hypothetical protein